MILYVYMHDIVCLYLDNHVRHEPRDAIAFIEPDNKVKCKKYNNQLLS